MIVTDITNMTHGNVCIAGMIENNRCVRPVIKGRFSQDWCHIDGHNIKPFSLITLNFGNTKQDPPHTEDRYIDPNDVVFQRNLLEVEKLQLLEDIFDSSVIEIFNAPIISAGDQNAFYVQKGTGNRSLGTIRPGKIIEFIYCHYPNGWDYRLTFNDKTKAQYTIKIVDLTFQTYLNNLRITQEWTCERIEHHVLKKILNRDDVFFRIGLARGWDKFPKRCYLQISGIYTFPDYLNGASFQELQQRIRNFRENDIPF